MEWMLRFCGAAVVLFVVSGSSWAQQHGADEPVDAVQPASPSPYQLTSVRKVSKPSYERVSLEQLPDLLGRTLRVATNNGHLIEGSLEEVKSRQLRLKQEMDGGVAVLPVRFDLIRHLEVLNP